MSFKHYLYDIATDKRNGFYVSLVKFILFILSVFYGLTVRVLIFSSNLGSRRFNCKVISVGNITLGGTGKTILVEFLAKYLRQKGHRIAILSRGYKRGSSGIDYPPVSYETMGDEPYMLKVKLKDVPVIVDKNRIRAISFAIRNYAVDTVILDDGFQQWRIKKDLEIVTIDATQPFGNRRVIPRGILREPLSSLRRADVFFLNKVNLTVSLEGIRQTLEKINPLAIIVEADYQPKGFWQLGNPDRLYGIDTLKGKTITLFSGIAHPESFEALIRNLDIDIGLSFRFPDHHSYSKQDLENIIQLSKQRNIDIIVTTEKDMTRVSCLSLPSGQFFLFALQVELKISRNEEGLYNRLHRIYNL
ncbi:MAG: tetraacyldisaccharide 4'-kinase [Candidatus Omnitrophica bacterium]|nr:tetraacyldisaccharide 4'-kinase [Candidatus Omnitrophota bacterium]